MHRIKNKETKHKDHTYFKGGGGHLLLYNKNIYWIEMGKKKRNKKYILETKSKTEIKFLKS